MEKLIEKEYLNQLINSIYHYKLKTIEYLDDSPLAGTSAREQTTLMITEGKSAQLSIKIGKMD